jgi:hypothetical protein
LTRSTSIASWFFGEDVEVEFQQNNNLFEDGEENASLVNHKGMEWAKTEEDPY